MKVKFWIGIAVSAGLIAGLYFMVDMGRLWAELKSVNPWYLVIAAISNIVFFYIRALRWRYMVEPVKKGVSTESLFSATMIGFMANNILPFRVGELARAYVLGRREDVSKGSVFTTIVVERLFDGLSVLLLLIIVLAFLPPEIAGGEVAVNIRRAGIASFVLYAVLMAGLMWSLYRPRAMTGLVRSVVRPFSEGFSEKAAYAAESFIAGLGVVKDARLLLYIILYSALHWGMLWVPNWLLFKSFGVGYGVYDAVLVLVVMAFSVALPSTPGAVGPFHAAAMGAMMLLGMDRERALGFAIVAHAVNLVPTVLVGLFFLHRENLSISGIKRAEAVTEA